MTLLSWRNHFTCDIFAENGSAHIESLCKWGPSTFTLRTSRAAERSAARGSGHPRPGRSDLGGRIRAFQAACARASRRPISRDRRSGSAGRWSGSGARRWRCKGSAEMSKDTSSQSIVVGFAGMTHLGIVSAASVAAKGFLTICYDPDAKLIARLAAGDIPVVEPDLDDLIRANGARQVFTADLSRLAECDVVYISTDVPTDDSGQSDLSGIVALIDRVARRAEARRPSCHSVARCRRAFTRGLRVAPHARLYYQVETLVFGRAVERALHPERTIVGCADPARRSSRVISPSSSPSAARSCRCATRAPNWRRSRSTAASSPRSASPTRWRRLCEKIGADWSEIVPALKLDARIGPHAYLSPGLGIAGGNLERDLATVDRAVGASSIRTRRRARVDRQQPTSPRLGGAHDPHRAARRTNRRRRSRSGASPTRRTRIRSRIRRRSQPSRQLPEARFVVHDPVVQRAMSRAHARVEAGADPLCRRQRRRRADDLDAVAAVPGDRPRTQIARSDARAHRSRSLSRA